MDKETVHKLLDLVLHVKNTDADIKFAALCSKGCACVISIYEWNNREITNARIFCLLRDGRWNDADLNYYTTQEIVEILEGLQDAEH